MSYCRMHNIISKLMYMYKVWMFKVDKVISCCVSQVMNEFKGIIKKCTNSTI